MAVHDDIVNNAAIPRLVRAVHIISASKDQRCIERQRKYDPMFHLTKSSSLRYSSHADLALHD